MKNYGIVTVKQATFLRGYFFDKELPSAVRAALDHVCSEFESIIADMNQMIEANAALAAERDLMLRYVDGGAKVSLSDEQIATISAEVDKIEAKPISLDEVKEEISVAFQIPRRLLDEPKPLPVCSICHIPIDGYGYDVTAHPACSAGKAFAEVRKITDEQPLIVARKEKPLPNFRCRAEPVIDAAEKLRPNYKNGNPNNVWELWQDDKLIAMKASNDPLERNVKHIATAVGKTVTQVHNRWYKIGKPHRKDFTQGADSSVIVEKHKAPMVIPRTILQPKDKAREAQQTGEA